jgi:glucose-6-phosphate isomerase
VPDEPHFHQSIDGCRAVTIGRHGLSEAELGHWLGLAGSALASLVDDHTKGRLPLLDVPSERMDIGAARTALERLSIGARTIVFFGTGGSSLGGQTLAQFAGWNIPGWSDEGQRSRPRTRFYDNLDADTLARALASLDLAATRFVVISKSGNTPETLVQAMAAIAAVRGAGLGGRLGELFLGVTEPAVSGRRNGLRTLLTAIGAPMLDHHTGIGGRYSVLTNVGLLPALARGLDAERLRSGAGDLIGRMKAGPIAVDFPPAVGAAVACGLAAERGIRIQVLMPYADRLGRLADWYVQLWAESLGKNGNGTTPLRCLGPLDQHSVLQLFMDGPREHLVTLIRIASGGNGPRIDPALARTVGLEEMAGRTVGDLVDAESHAIEAALGRAGRPVRAIDLLRLDEAALGALLMHFMIETILAGRILGIDPFDQPAVELGKAITRDRLRSMAPRG